METRDWVTEVRSVIATVSVADFAKLLTDSLQEISDIQQCTEMQAYVLQEMLAETMFLIEGRVVTDTAKHRRAAHYQNGDRIRQAALDLVQQGHRVITAQDVVNALVAKGYAEYAGRGRRGSVGTTLRHFKDFRKNTITKEYAYIRDDLVNQSTRETEAPGML